MNVDFKFSCSRFFTNWLNENKCNILISSFSTDHVLTLSTNQDSAPFMYYTNIPRAMGMSQYEDTLLISSHGNLITYYDIGKMGDIDHGTFDKNYIPLTTLHKPDIDIHDVVMTKDKKIYYISSLYSCICTPNYFNKTFNIYWKPKWISKMAAEDRCHLNGLCCIDGEPRFVTSICMNDTTRSWSDDKKVKKGIVYDIISDEIYCKDLSFPHSPRWYNNMLWVLESGSGYFGFIENNKFERKVFIPGFLRGLIFHNNYAIVNTSIDRHTKNFKEYELGDILETKKLKEKCGIWIIDINTFDIVHSLIFTGDVKELYDIAIVPNCKDRKSVV